jgi:hypothetical protein
VSSTRTIGTCTLIVRPTAQHFTVCTNANLVGAALSGVNLSYANLSGANLTGAILTKANLSYAKLNSATLVRATLKGAALTGVTWSSTTCPDTTDSNNENGTCAADLSTTAKVIALPDPNGAAAQLAATGLRVLPLVLSGSGLIVLGLLLLQWAQVMGRRRARGADG